MGSGKELKHTMLTGMNVVFIGGDARQVEVIKKCSELDATIHLIGYDQFESEDSGVSKATLSSPVLEKADALILPIAGTDADGVVESRFSEQTIILKDEHVQRLPEHCHIYSGMANAYLQQLMSQHDKQLVLLLDRDDVAIYNSIPTVEGTIMMVIQNTDTTIHGSEAVILGWGRTGLTLAKTFHALGARVKVGARKSHHLARVYEMGMTAFHVQDLEKEVQQCDLLLNTVPELIVKANIIARMPTQSLIIDLASSPGGVDFRYAEKRGIKALLAPGLPGIVAPKTAGRILAEVVTQLMREQTFPGRDE